MGDRLRLAPSASVTLTRAGALVRSDLGTLELTGADLGAFVERILPLLDGTRTREEIAGSLPGYSAASIASLLRVLEERRVLEPVGEDEPAEAWWRPQGEWLARFTDAGQARRRLAEARVVVVGLEGWGAIAAAELAAAGVGRLHLADDAPVAPEDVALARPWRDEDRGRPRAQALRDRLSAAEGPGRAAVTAAPPGAGPAGALAEPADLVLMALPADALQAAHAVARAAHAARVRSLIGHLEGTDAVAGPLVIPGATACWNCCRLRTLAHAEDPGAAHRVQAAMLAGPAPRRARTYLAPAAGLLGHMLALEAVKALTGYAPSELAGRQLVQSLVTLRSSLHGIVRMPWCDVCGGAGEPGEAPGGVVLDPPVPLDEHREPEALRAALDGWVDPRTGVIGHLVLGAPDARTPELPVTATAVLARYTDGAPAHAHAHDHELASGKGRTAVEAMTGAVGEAVERYSAARYRREDLTRAPLGELGGDVLDPRALCLYLDEQYAREAFPYDRVDPEKPLDWVHGRWLDTGEPVWLPALPVHYDFAAPPGERFCQVTSSGLAAGRDEADAALRAAIELVERDAFTLTWLARLPARRLLADGGLDADTQEAARQLGTLGAELELWLLDAGIPLPVVACLGLGDGERWPGLTLSLAADPSPRAAARKAILEHGHVGPYVRRLWADEGMPVPAAPEEVRTLLDHALYYAPPERRAARAFLAADGAAPVALAELEEPDAPREETVRAALAAGGVRVAVADVTAPDVRTGPFRVARALGPDVQPIHFGAGLERLGGGRLRALLGGPPNPEPHPLA